MAVAGGFSGDTNLNTGTITIDPKKLANRDEAWEVLAFELGNLTQKDAFLAVDRDGEQGLLSREEYIRRVERLEYNNHPAEKAIYDEIKPDVPFLDAWAMKPFEEFYMELAENHKENYGKFWDNDYKSAYEKRHAPSKPWIEIPRIRIIPESWEDGYREFKKWLSFPTPWA